MIFFGMRPSPTIPESATIGRRDSTAASAKARDQRNAGRSNKSGSRFNLTVTGTSASASRKISRPMLKKFTGRRLPAIRKQQRRNKQHREEFGSNSTCKTRTSAHASSAPMAICIRAGRGNTRVNTPTARPQEVMMKLLAKKISMRSLFAMFFL